MIEGHFDRRRDPLRRGMTMLLVLVILAISMLVLGRATSSIVLERNQAQLRHTQRQSRLIAAAALDRAAAKLSTNEEYDGETWTIAPTDVSLPGAWRVDIAITATDGARKTISVTVTYPATGTPRVAETAERRLQDI
jgi:hypothetical protein